MKPTEDKEKELQDVKIIMDTTKVELVKKMEKVKFRRKVFKASKLFTKNDLEEVILDWDTLKDETKIEWFDTVLFRTKDDEGKEQMKTYEEVLMIVNFLKGNKMNLAQTFRDIKTYGSIKKNLTKKEKKEE